MSRVDDDRDAARMAERLMQEKKLAETQAKKRQGEASAFQKLMGQQAQAEKAPPPTPGKPQAPQGGLARQVLAQATAQGKTFDERVQQSRTGDEGLVMARKEDAGQTQARSESRATTAKEDRKTSDTRDGDLSKADASSGQARSEKGDLKADANGGGGKGSGGGGDRDRKEGGGGMAPGFRFNPALMAPVPVAQPKDTARSERLRAMASEIAQKIVERVRVGTNTAGQAEFQIDLRGDVLSGLSIKVSAKNGKISAVFSGTNREVLKMLEDQSEGLRTALNGRGLKLENVRFEAKT